MQIAPLRPRSAEEHGPAPAAAERGKAPDAKQKSL
jgi:hypothetical protein